MNDTKYKITNGITMQVEDVMCNGLHIRMRDITEVDFNLCDYDTGCHALAAAYVAGAEYVATQPTDANDSFRENLTNDISRKIKELEALEEKRTYLKYSELLKNQKH